jgi:hypothetical protein
MEEEFQDSRRIVFINGRRGTLEPRLSFAAGRGSQAAPDQQKATL